jgi:hypothetical protein
MGASAQSQSDTIIRPKSLSERLAAERLAAETPAPEAMAERFAPGAPRNLNGLSGRTIIEPQRLLGLPPVRSGNRALLVAALIISLIPTAVILGLLWQGAIRLPGESRVLKSETAQFQDTQEASPAASLLKTALEIALTSDSRIVAKPGEDVRFNIAIRGSTDRLPARSIIAIRALPPGTTFSRGRPYGSSEWSLTPEEIDDLRLHLPKNTTAGADIRIELISADGTVLASATTKLDIAQDPRAGLILRSDESDRVEDLIKHGQKMIDVGYLAGARAYFKRAAEAGSGEAALLVGACYDPTFIAKLGAQGIKPDVKEARNWYERAKQLGVPNADAKLAELAEQWGDTRTALQEPRGAAAPSAAEEAGATGGAEAPSEPTGQPSPSVPTIAADNHSFGDEEWVELSSFVNVRMAPSQTAETLRIAQKGEKLRVIGRTSNWVQVTDPATNESGWVYGRFLETAQSPTH